MDPTSNTDLELETRTTLAVCEAIDTPRALTVSLLIRNEEWMQLAKLTWNPDHYLDPWQGALDRQVSEMMRKSVNMPLEVDRKAAALASFYEAESACSRTNSRLQCIDYVDHPDWWRRVERRLDEILGDLTVDDLQTVVDAGRLGPGSVIGLERVEHWSRSHKFDIVPTVLESLVPYASTLFPEGWLDYRPEVDVVDYNIWLSVPKDALKDRGICKSSLFTVWYQLGVGEVLRSRLLRSGIDLRDQNRNRMLAKRAWRDGLATIDLRSASDMLAYEVPVRLLSDRWEALLALGRERFTMVEKKKIELAKYCAMGNGYTFPLQTLIFWAVVTSVVPRARHADCSCYGDDIICPQEYASVVIDALEYLGFSVNISKSFLAGSFFESCGTDWLYGHDVRPFYLRRDDVDGEELPIPYGLQIANSLRVWSSRIMGHAGCWSGVRGVWENLRKGLPRPWASCKVPVSFGDSGVICSLSEARPRRAQDGHEGFAIRCVQVMPVFVDRRTPGVLLAALAGMRTSPIDMRSNGASPQLLDPSTWRKIWLNGSAPSQKVDIATKGLEPCRGLYGNVRIGVSVTSMWPDGLDWI